MDKYYNYETCDSKEKIIKSLKRRIFKEGGWVLKIKIPYDYLEKIRKRQRDLNMNNSNCADYLVYLIEKDLKENSFEKRGENEKGNSY